MLTTLRQQFEMQRKDILANANTTTLRKAFKAKGGTNQQDKRNYLAALLAWSAYSDTMRKALAPILYALIAETGKQAMTEVNQEASQFNPTTLNVLNYQQQRAAKIAADVNAETEKQLRASISQGIDQGESDDELRARIELVMGAALTYRADRISQTEVTRAQSFADIEAWKQSGTVTGLRWYTIIDERTCPWCADMLDVIVKIDQPFFSLGDVMHSDGKPLEFNYDEVDGPPLHVNCRCSLEPVTVSLSDL